MEKSIKKFLEFNGKVIDFLAKDGHYWVAIKPICEALNINYKGQIRMIKNDPDLAQLGQLATLVAADNKARKMFCLPEEFVYGWIFQIKAANPELKKYRLKIYQLIFEYFHGAITSREKFIVEKTKAEIEYEKLMRDILSTPEGQRAAELEKEIKICRAGLRNLDREIERNQLSLFNSQS